MKVWIDQRRCRGHARCLEIAPDAFDFIDEEDRAVVVVDGVLRTSVEELMDAQLECPEQAIHVEDHGSIIAEQEGPK
jgi:ferredoxin